MRLSITAHKKTTATEFCANMVFTISGKILNMSGADVNPSPILSERLAIIILRCENPHLAIMPKLANTILPNIKRVQPPRTHWGIVENMAPIGGDSPQRISITAPVAMVKRLITLDKVASPTFCENDVMGVQPKRPATLLTRPSQATDAPISFCFTSRLRAPEQRA